MKMVIAIVQGKDGEVIQRALNSRGFHATVINSVGGFLGERNLTMLIGVQESYLADLIRIIRENCHARVRYVNPLLPILEPAEFHVPDPVEVQVGGATLFVLGVERYERIA